jgi:hypothetical protein
VAKLKSACEFSRITAIDLSQCVRRRVADYYRMDFHLAVLLMVGVALTYFLSRVLWHWRQG